MIPATGSFIPKTNKNKKAGFILIQKKPAFFFCAYFKQKLVKNRIQTEKYEYLIQFFPKIVQYQPFQMFHR